MRHISLVTTSRRAWVRITGLSMLFLLAGAPVVSAEPTATESVNRVITEVMRILDDPALKQPARSVERRQAIEDVVKQHVNYEEMARRALGAPWMEINSLEREEFVGLFVGLLRDMLAGRISDYSRNQVVYLSEYREGNVAEVCTAWIGSKVDTSFDVRLTKEASGWLMYDAVIDGASIVENYRAQFARIIRDASYEGLVSRMKQKILFVKAFEYAAVR